MTQPFKFRYVNTIAGAFVLFCAALLIAGVFVAGRAQGWFEPRIRLAAVFTTAEGAYGLQEGAEVRILDASAGRVARIAPSADGLLQAELLVRQRFAGFINRGSQALVKRKIVGLAGDAYVEIQPGRPGYDPFESGDLIEIARDEEIIDTIRQVIDELQTLLIPVVEEARGVLENVNRITGAIEAGEGVLGMLVRDDEVADSVRDMTDTARLTVAGLPPLTDQFRELMERVLAMTDPARATVENARTISGSFVDMAGDLARETGAIGVLIRETVESLRELNVLLRALQNHWLLRRHVEPAAAGRLPMPSPSEIGGGRRPRP